MTAAVFMWMFAIWFFLVLWVVGFFWSSNYFPGKSGKGVVLYLLATFAIGFFVSWAFV